MVSRPKMGSKFNIRTFDLEPFFGRENICPGRTSTLLLELNSKKIRVELARESLTAHKNFSNFRLEPAQRFWRKKLRRIIPPGEPSPSWDAVDCISWKPILFALFLRSDISHVRSEIGHQSAIRLPSRKGGKNWRQKLSQRKSRLLVPLASISCLPYNNMMAHRRAPEKEAL